jgi:hypothetical protein
MHIAKSHPLDECPICKVRYRNLTWHFRVYGEVYDDAQHLVLYYLYSRHTLDHEEKEVVEKMLKVRG